MQEIPARLLLKTITPLRLVNAARALAGLGLSAITRRTFVWGRPFILTLEPTNICNLKCPLCVTGNGKMSRAQGSMSFETFSKTIEETGRYLFYILLYQQGEPFINREFLRFVRAAKQRRIFVTTSTNGHYLDPETARQTVASGLDSLIISIDGAAQASYAKYRVGGHLDKVKQAVRNLVDARKRQGSATPVILLQFIVMRHNEHEISRMKTLAKELGADKLLIKTVQVETPSEAAEWLPQAEAYRRYQTTGDALTPKRRGAGPCPRPWTSALVNWDGSVVPCCFDKNAVHQTGSVTEGETFNQIWNSGEYADFRKQMLTDRNALDICANCSQGLRLYR